MVRVYHTIQSRSCSLDNAGDILHLDALGQPLIILNTRKAALDLLHRRPQYSDRPMQTMAGKLCLSLLRRKETLILTMFSLAWATAAIPPASPVMKSGENIDAS